MAHSNSPSVRIDWFDGSIVENPKPSTTATEFANEEQTGSEEQKPVQKEKKPIGFMRLQDMSQMEPDRLIVEVTHQPGFWKLFDQEELKADFIVLIVKILEKVLENIESKKQNSKLKQLLEKRFLSSNFLEKLTAYVTTLPSVKIVEKRMNSQLWDDVESFLFNAVRVCKGIALFFGEKDNGIRTRLIKLLNALCQAALGVHDQHSEHIDELLFEMIFHLKNSMESTAAPADIPSTDSFKILNIFPTLHDMLTPQMIANQRGSTNKESTKEISIKETIKIEPILECGAYPNVAHYLDVQFRLLREDYFGPLRNGICAYLENPSKTRHESIRVYHDVRILGTIVKNNKVGHLVDFAWKQRNVSNEDIKEKHAKRLMFGSLLLFTRDNFHTILCATVLDSDEKKLKEGYVTVSFQNPVSKNILSETYLMIESEVFFEPYHQVLKVLQGSSLDDLPMKKYIVNVKPEPHSPAYLTNKTQYTIEAPDKSEKLFTVLDLKNWPKKHLGLDDSQFEAYQFALTREFAVIQGPPGTGKTFIGVKIASTILKNLSLEGTPMLIICYTNHALDQFLEGILKVTKSVIRLGSQSKSKELEPYMLNNVKAKMKYKNPFFYACKQELEKVYQEIVQLQTEIETCDTEILTYKTIKPFLIIDGKKYELKQAKEDRVLYWLFEHLEDPKQQMIQEQKNYDEEDTWENLDEIDLNKDKTKGCFSDKIANRQIETIDALLRFHDGENGDKSFVATPFLQKKDQILKRARFFKRKMLHFNKEKKEYKINKVNDLYDLSTDQRWEMYFNAAHRVKDELLTKMDVLLERHKAASEDLEELTTLVDSEVVRTARVVGVTTTGAARRHELIKKIKSPIVIVEEAAEVLEAHIIASLTFSLQHLILIGDHKQLRPTAANYKLAKECNIEISLFERMIRNGVHARTLTTQRRMRPEFSSLLVPEIYPVLNNHESVFKYPNVKGMEKNLFFCYHEAMESTVDDGYSHENCHEASLCVDLARHLLKHGYAPEDITILTTYTAQVLRIRKICLQCECQSDRQLLENVKITTVDNFQGEESRIVLLSLVRSNRDNKIGFLSETNRVCVALSRAKEGFYIFGNLRMLSTASAMWKAIKSKLELQDATGESLPVSTVSSPI